MPAGRPTKYKKRYCKDIIDYFTKTTDTLPTDAGFAVKIGVCIDTILEWRKVHPEFSVACKRARIIQQDKWIQNSLNGEYNTAFSIFLGKNVFKWRDKQDIEHSGNVNIEIVKFSEDQDTK